MGTRGGFTILIVDDDQATLDPLSTLLQRQGYRVRTVATGTEGLAVAQDPDIALVLLEILLPDLSGFDVCLKLKEKRPLLPIIFLTESDEPFDIVTGLDNGANDYILKSCANSVLLARVRAALRAGRPREVDALSQSIEPDAVGISSALLAVTEPLASLVRPDDIADAIIERTGLVLGFEHLGICIWAEDAGRVARRHTRASDGELGTRLLGMGPEWDRALYAELRARKGPIAADASYPVHPLLLALHAQLDAGATLVAPIKCRAKLFGALFVLRNAQSAFDSRDLAIVAGITCAAGKALARADAARGLGHENIEDIERLQPASEVLGLISHELRTPVAAVKGFISTLRENHRYWTEQECECFLQNVNESVDQLSRLIENALEMGRLDQGLRLFKRPTELNLLVQRVLQDLGGKSGHCELTNEIPANLPTVAVDPLKIERVLFNLVENAIRFSPQGGKIRVAATASDGTLEVSITDQGIGIAPQYLPHVFERFCRAGDPQARQDGIGLGLHIARELVRRHGGQIWADSQPGRGTAVRFTLPLSDILPKSEGTSQGSLSVPVRPEARFGSNHLSSQGQVTILIVEDDPQTLSSLQAGLEAAGARLLMTSYGREAIELIQDQEPDLALLDLSLPDLDGFIVCERVRRFSDTPIIIITGRRTECQKIRALDLGADDFITKPFSDRELVARIRAVLRRTQVPCTVRPQGCLCFGDLEIHPLTQSVNTPAGLVELTPTEHKLLYYLASNAGRTLTYQQLLDHVWGYDGDGERDSLWVHISRLRNKIERDGRCAPYILTERSVGYRFRAPDPVQ